MRLLSLVMIVALLGGACASASQRLVAFPARGQTPAQMQTDKGECEGYAEANKSNEEVLKSIGVSTLGGAAAGTLGGTVLGALGSTGAGRGAGIGAAIGAVTGLIAGVWTGVAAERNHYFAVYTACMNARGYSVGG